VKLQKLFRKKNIHGYNVNPDKYFNVVHAV